MKSTTQKLAELRKIMQAESVQACIIPTTDPHISEYTPEYWKTRSWLSGFTGSAGMLVVTGSKAGLWTDSRYFLQAADQLKDTGIDLFKMGMPGTPDHKDWIMSELKPGDTVGFEGLVYAASDAKELLEIFQANGLRVNPTFAPYDLIWEDRPPVPTNPVFVLPERFSGKSSRDKIQEVLTLLKKENTSATILASLDMIAWLFNLRGNDVEYNPVAVSYAYVSKKETILFINPKKLSDEVVEYLREQKVLIADYEKFYTYLSNITENTSILLTPSKINYQIRTSLPAHCIIKEIAVHPVDDLKAIKNETELAGVKNAMRKDGVALVKFHIWLETSLKNGKKITELDVSKKLLQYRSEQEFFFGESFETIAGYGEHGAIVHYGASEETNAEIKAKGILLLDSGAQYFDGTTDITRTIACGEVSDEMKKDYTNVLKGNIALSSAHFPAGTVGMQLDILARQYLWNDSCNFFHGTGHGIGHFLNVHEGPQSIRMNFNPVTLKPGMITSNEPGLYRAGKYGIRIENLILTVLDKTTEFGDFYRFETLTLCPIDTKLIDISLMTQEEINWLNVYHKKVYDELSPLLSDKEKEWLMSYIKPINNNKKCKNSL